MPKKEVSFTAYIRADGKLTVPKGVRDALDIQEGDLIECKVNKVRGQKHEEAKGNVDNERE